MTAELQIEEMVEAELLEFAKRMKHRGASTAEALAHLVAQAAFSFGMTLKASGVNEAEAMGFVDAIHKDLDTKFQAGYAADISEGTVVV